MYVQSFLHYTASQTNEWTESRNFQSSQFPVHFITRSRLWTRLAQSVSFCCPALPYPALPLSLSLSLLSIFLRLSHRLLHRSQTSEEAELYSTLWRRVSAAAAVSGHSWGSMTHPSSSLPRLHRPISSPDGGFPSSSLSPPACCQAVHSSCLATHLNRPHSNQSKPVFL